MGMSQGTDKKFAMKTLDKFEMQERNKVQRVLTEELILTSVDHPFLPTLYSCMCPELVGEALEMACPKKLDSACQHSFRRMNFA
eukprot:scaffold130016_cov21-Tisochrysis_lutea.AAC.1